MQLPWTPAGDQQQAALRAPRRRRPRRARARAAFVSGSATNSIASIAPSPRTSPIAGQRSCQASMRAADRLADRDRALDEPLLLDHVEHGQRRGLRDRVADVGAADAAGAGRVHDLRAAEHAREREAHRDRLRDRDQVGLDAEVLHREEAPGAPEAGLHLVGDEHDPVLVADPAERPARTRRRRRRSRPRPARARSRSPPRSRPRPASRTRARAPPAHRSRRTAAVGVRERHAVDLGRERAEARPCTGASSR